MSIDMSSVVHCIALVYVIIYYLKTCHETSLLFSVSCHKGHELNIHLLYEVNIVKKKTQYKKKCTHFSKAYTYVLVRVTILHYTFVWRLIPLLSYFILMVAFLIDFTISNDLLHFHNHLLIQGRTLHGHGFRSVVE
ncbi:hypothetical protein V1477_007184 [Vespula maculifrons]|uniref:Uncharacterized protein n=1 Tax=Vespula maculifrons TaxID=7453 RepID=A0ABD2CHT7_VESMC